MSTNKLLRIQFGGVDYYFAEHTTNLGGKQWLGRITAESGEVMRKVGAFQAFEAAPIKIVLDNSNGFFNDFVLETLLGSDAEIYFGSTSLKRYYVLSGHIENQKLYLTLTDQFENLLDAPVWNRRITKNVYPNAVTTALNKVINYVVGEFPKPSNSADYGKYMVRCEYVNKSATEKYLIGKFALSSGLTLDLVYDPAGTDITGSCSLVYNATEDYYYINYTTGTQPDYIRVNFTLALVTSGQLISQIFNLFTQNVDISRLGSPYPAYFVHHILNYDDETGRSRWNYVINESSSGKKILNEI